MGTKSALAIVAAFACLSAAPAIPAAHHGPIDGSTTVTNGVSTLLFGGAVPPNGFMVQSFGNCYVNDNGPANIQAGFLVLPNTTLITPTGYKPMGPVSIYCAGGLGGYVAARAW
jgi:hypothetical protein